MISTATVSAGLGLLLVAASHQAQAAFAGVLVPGRLFFSRLPPERDRLSSGTRYPSVLTLLFGRMYDRMGDDMQAWTDIRLRAAQPEPKWIADAVRYYANQVHRRVRDERVRAELDYRQRSIECSMEIVRLINLDTTQARLREHLQAHPSIQVRNYPDDDLHLLASHLKSDALSELHQFLDRIYQLGYHKQLIYPMRPSAYRFPARLSGPTAPDA